MESHWYGDVLHLPCKKYLIYPKKETGAKSIALDQLASPPFTNRRCACLIHRACSAGLLGNGPVMQCVFSGVGCAVPMASLL